MIHYLPLTVSSNGMTATPLPNKLSSAFGASILRKFVFRKLNEVKTNGLHQTYSRSQKRLSDMKLKTLSLDMGSVGLCFLPRQVEIQYEH
ncbi:hypothetical protein TNCV_4276381 [Trichonephila clavipes]|nr:hypothetical protein TNCV_4276381 [Trichonephila clavipes]